MWQTRHRALQVCRGISSIFDAVAGDVPHRHDQTFRQQKPPLPF